jgi:Xaa-Pro aminopeptidase
MESFFTDKFFAGNRARLREACDQELVVVTANGLLQRGADTAYRFSQDANFWYLSGIDDPDVVLVMNGSEEYLILPERSEYQKIFDDAATDSELTVRSGIKKIYKYDEGWDRLGRQLGKTGRAATLLPPKNYIDIYGMYTNPARAALVKRMKSYQRSLKLENIAEHLSSQRMIKQAEEIGAIQAAVDITVDSLKNAFKRTYKYEHELEAAITAGFRRRGAAGHASEPIVAAGQRACTLHSVTNDGEVLGSDLVVVDVGAEVEHYAADITRTVIFGPPSARQKAVSDAVLEAQEFAISLLRPGLEFKDYRDQTDLFIGEKLKELGLIKSINKTSIHKYFPHGISHFLGLNTHDAGDYSRPIQPGMVLTVEPGIYIPGEGIGVRIEDDILITDTGYEILSDKLPKRLS